MQEADWKRTALHRAVESANADLVELLLHTPLGTEPSAPIALTPAEEDQIRRELLLARDKFGSTALQMARASVRVPYNDRQRKSSLARLLELLERACDELGVPTEEELEEEMEMDDKGSSSDSEMETSSDNDEDEEEESDDMETEEPAPGAVAVDVAGAVADAHSNEERPRQNSDKSTAKLNN